MAVFKILIIFILHSKNSFDEDSRLIFLIYIFYLFLCKKD